MLLSTKSATFHLNERTHVMGILNITPDSFSDGGRYANLDKAVSRAKQMIAEGADLIDVGGESTRPDHKSISPQEEMQRVLPVIEALKSEVTVPISIDTYKAETAEAAIKAGAEIINDIWGAKHDPDMSSVAAKFDVPIILMHNRTNKSYGSLINEMITDLQMSIDIVKRSGVKDSNIILDPGIGFGKTLEHNFIVMNHLERLCNAFPYPFLLGASRKSFIGSVLPNAAEERDNATGATTCLGITKGIKIVRVHDVKRHVELSKMMDAMLRGIDESG